MPKTKVYSVRLQSLTSISPKAFLAKAFDGSEAVLPKSQVFGPDFDVSKSEAYWIAAWILEQKNLQFSNKKEGWYNPDKRIVEPSVHIIVENHVPDRKEPKEVQPHASLIKKPRS